MMYLNPKSVKPHADLIYDMSCEAGIKGRRNQGEADQISKLQSVVQTSALKQLHNEATCPSVPRNYPGRKGGIPRTTNSPPSSQFKYNLMTSSLVNSPSIDKRNSLPTTQHSNHKLASALLVGNAAPTRCLAHLACITVYKEATFCSLSTKGDSGA